MCHTLSNAASGELVRNARDYLATKRLRLSINTVDICLTRVSGRDVS